MCRKFGHAASPEEMNGDQYQIELCSNCGAVEGCAHVLPAASERTDDRQHWPATHRSRGYLSGPKGSEGKVFKISGGGAVFKISEHLRLFGSTRALRKASRKSSVRRSRSP